MHEEGDGCPTGCGGRLKFEVLDCSCHIAPPCSACVDAQLICDECGWTEGWSTTSSRALSESFSTPNLYLSMILAERAYMNVSKWLYSQIDEPRRQFPWYS